MKDTIYVQRILSLIFDVSEYHNSMYSEEACTDQIFKARATWLQYRTGPARAEVKKKISSWTETEVEISVRARSGPKEKLKFRSEPDPARNEIQNFGQGPAQPIFFPVSARITWF